MIHLLYLGGCTWEFDLITKDILFNIEKKIEIFTKDNFNSLVNRTDIIDNNILVINISLNFKDVVNVISKIKPICIFYLSDEQGTRPYTINLSNFTKILFSQYNHTHYNYSNNRYQLPCAYATFFLNKKRSFDVQPKQVKDREINASFIGAVKEDRTHMTSVFNSNMKNTNLIFVENNWNISDLSYSPGKCFEIYNNSIFVLGGRGNHCLDCSRIYEAIVAGAIPVVVGTLDEIKNTFYYNNNIPPLIYDDSWEKVVVKCNDLLEDKERLQKIQNDLILWWNNRISFMNELILREIRTN